MHWTYYALFAALALAVADVLIKVAAGKVPDSLGMLLYGAVPFLIGAVWHLPQQARSVASFSTVGIAAALGVGVMFSMVTFCMYAAFRAGAPISLASPLIRLGGLVVASVAGLLLWREPITARYVIGLFLVAGGIYLMLTR
jgi:drug/metabolite transporter (DMT)-like permease